MLPGYHPLQAARGGDRYAPWNLSYSWSAAIQMPLFQVSSSRVRVRVRVSTSLPEHASYPTPPTSHCLPYYYLTTTLLLPYYYLTATLLLPYLARTLTLPAVQRRVPRAARGHQPAPQGHGHALRRQPQGRLRSGPWEDVGSNPNPGVFASV